jgi:hypothetical protein
MLIDPIEEQLYLPSLAVELGDEDIGQREVAGRKNEPFSLFGVKETNVSQPV